MLRVSSRQDGPAEWVFNDLHEVPSEFVDFLQLYSGSFLKPNHLLTPDGNRVNVRNILCQDESNCVCDANASMRTLGFIPFAEDGMGNYIGICVSQDLWGSIVYWDHEHFYSTAKGLSEWVISNSINQFESTSVVFEEDDDLPPFKVLGGWVDPDFKPEFD